MARRPPEVASLPNTLLRLVIPIAVLAASIAPSASAASSTVVISQVYAAGGEAGATWRNDYVVLFNKSTAPVSLTGWTLQMKAMLTPAWQAIPLCGSIASGHYYLVQLAQGGPLGNPLPPADCGGSVGMEKSNFTVVLLSDAVPISVPCPASPNVVDLVGWGPGLPCAEGTAVAASPDPTFALLRSAPCVDTDDNSIDFAVAPANPQNSSATNPCVNQPPAIDPIPPLTVDETATLDQPVAASDPDGNIVTLSLAGQPSFVTLIPNLPPSSSVTGTLRIQPGPNAAEGAPSKQWCFQLVATDDGAGPATSQTPVCVTVNRTNSPVYFTQTPPPAVPMNEGEVSQFAISALDDDLEQTLTFSLVSAPPFASIATDPTVPGGGATGRLTLSPGPNSKGSWCFSVRVQDSDAGAAAAPVCVTVNALPVIQPIPDQVLMELSVHSFFASAVDPEGSAVTYGTTGPAWFTINATTGECTLAPDLVAAETNGGVYAASVTASDGIATSSDDFMITVTDLTTAANIPFSGVWPGGVVMATNELCYEHADIVWAVGDHDFGTDGERDCDLIFGRYHASMLDREGVTFGHLGTNWLGTYDWKMVDNGATETITTNRGARLLFGELVGGERAQMDHFEDKCTLKIDAYNNVHRFHRGRTRRTYEFNGTSGLLQKILDEHGNSLTCTYSGNLLSEVSDGHGRTLNFTYDASSNLSMVSGGGRSVSYRVAGGLLTAFTNTEGQTTTYSYAAGPYPGLLTGVTTPLGATPMTWAYDADGRVSSQTDAMANTWTFGVGPGGGCVMTMPTGGTWEATHDTGHRLLTLLDPLGGTTSWTYDANGRRASATRPLGDVTTIAYDAASGYPADVGRADGTHVLLTYGSTPIDGFEVFHATGISYPDGTSESFGYDAAGNLVTHTDQVGQNWTATCNANGQVLTQTNPVGGVTIYSYDPQLRLASRTDDAGNTTTFTYDALSRLTKVTHPDGTMRSFAYDALDHLTSMTDERGKAWAYAYDANGRLLSETDPLLHATQFQYDALDRVTHVIDPLGSTEVYAYDAAGRLASATDRTGRMTIYTHDALGSVAGIIGPEGSTYSFTYDANRRLTSRQDPLGHVVLIGHDRLDRATHITDPIGSGFDCAYDTMGRLTSANGPLGRTESFSYDPRGLLASISDVTSETDFARTPLGEVSALTDPNRHVWPRAYDPQGRLTNAADPLGRTTTYEYDSRSRPTRIGRPDGTVGPIVYDASGSIQIVGPFDGDVANTTLNFSYDDANRLVSATGASFAYDAPGRLINSNGLEMTYDAEGRMTSEIYAPGKVVTYGYDTRGLLSQVMDWMGGTTTFAFDAAGRLTGLTRPNGIATAYQYDAADRLIQSVERPPNPNSPLSSITLTRDALEQPTSIDRRQPLMPRITSPSTTGFTYDAASQIDGLSWDPMGRLLGDGSRTFEWDALSRLTHYAAGADSPRFTYDAFGRMLSRTLGAQAESYVWNYATAVPTLASINPGPPQTRYFVYAPSGLLLYSVDAATGARRFYHFDEAGNTIFLTNDSGSVTTQYAYTPFGSMTALGQTAGNPFTFGAAAGMIHLGSSLDWGPGHLTFDALTRRVISGNTTESGLSLVQPGPDQLPGTIKPQGDFNLSNRFSLEIDGVMVAGVHSVESNERGTDVVEYKDGEDGVLRLRPGRHKPSKLTLTKEWPNALEWYKWRKNDGYPSDPIWFMIDCHVDDIKDRGTSSVFGRAGSPDPHENLVISGPIDTWVIRYVMEAGPRLVIGDLSRPGGGQFVNLRGRPCEMDRRYRWYVHRYGGPAPYPLWSCDR